MNSSKSFDVVGFSNLSDEQKIIENEKFFETLKQRYTEYDEKSNFFIEKVNVALESRVSTEDLKRIVLDPECKRLLNLNDDFLKLLRILPTVEKEFFVGEPSFLFNIDSLEELSELLTRIRFVFRRICFGDSEDEWYTKLDEILEDNVISSVFIVDTVYKELNRSKYICGRIAEYMNIRGMNVDSKKILALVEMYEQQD